MPRTAANGILDEQVHATEAPPAAVHMYDTPYSTYYSTVHGHWRAYWVECRRPSASAAHLKLTGDIRLALLVASSLALDEGTRGGIFTVVGGLCSTPACLVQSPPLVAHVTPVLPQNNRPIASLRPHVSLATMSRLGRRGVFGRACDVR